MAVKHPKGTKTVYCCGVDWQHEINEAPDLEGKMPLYSSIKELKKRRTCWAECGLVEIKLKLVKWHEPQDFNFIKKTRKRKK